MLASTLVIAAVLLFQPATFQTQLLISGVSFLFGVVCAFVSFGNYRFQLVIEPRDGKDEDGEGA